MEAGTHATSAPRWPRVLLIVVLCLAAAVLVAMWAFGRFYFADRAPMGSSFAGQSMAGRTRAEVTQAVRAKAEDTRLTFAVDGRPATPLSYAQLGMKPDIQATVDAVMASKGSNPFAKSWVGPARSVALKADVDSAAALDRVNAAVLQDGEGMSNPTVAYSEQSHSFVSTPGKSGKAVDSKPALSAITASLSSPERAQTVAASLKDASPTIQDSVAQQAAAQANRSLAARYEVTNGRTKRYVIPSDQVAQWLQVTSDTAKGTMGVKLDAAAEKEWIGKNIPEQLAVAPTDQHDLYTPDGRKIAVKIAGANGLKVTSTDQVAQTVTAAIESGRSTVATAPTASVAFKTVKETVPHNFGVANGDPWLQVDLAAQTLTTYRGTTKVATYPVATGKPGHETHDGTFYIYLRYTSQTMRGPGYVTPGVKDVNYFDGSIATHGAPWNIANIDAGRPSSHGCINMKPADAHAVYEFAPLGTMVQVINRTVSGNAR